MRQGNQYQEVKRQVQNETNNVCVHCTCILYILKTSTSTNLFSSNYLFIRPYYFIIHYQTYRVGCRTIPMKEIKFRKQLKKHGMMVLIVFENFCDEVTKYEEYCFDVNMMSRSHFRPPRKGIILGRI